MSKAELRRTKAKLKEREGSVPAVVFTRKRKHRMTGRRVTMSEAELTGPKPNFGLPVTDDRRKRKGGWKKVDRVPLLKKDVDDDGLKITNGVDVNPALIAGIKAVVDVKVAKKIARIANSWFRKLYGLEEVRMVREFQPGDDVWWRKKSIVHTGRVVKLKSRKLVVKTSPEGDEYVVLPVRKVTKGAVPKEYLQPDPKRWRVGRAREKGGETKSAEAVVQ
jgi:hypothetical protein